MTLYQIPYFQPLGANSLKYVCSALRRTFTASSNLSKSPRYMSFPLTQIAAFHFLFWDIQLTPVTPLVLSFREPLFILFCDGVHILRFWSLLSILFMFLWSTRLLWPTMILCIFKVAP